VDFFVGLERQRQSKGKIKGKSGGEEKTRGKARGD
jgi:hypothetical protein